MDGKYGSSKHSDLKLVLSAIRRAIPELHGVMIASQDGLAIAHDFPGGGRGAHSRDGRHRAGAR